MTSIDYLGKGSVYPLYRAIVREILSATHRNCDVKVMTSDRVRFAVYGEGKMNLLNTDYDLPSHAVITTPDDTIELTLAPLELKAVTL